MNQTHMQSVFVLWTDSLFFTHLWAWMIGRKKITQKNERKCYKIYPHLKIKCNCHTKWHLRLTNDNGWSLIYDFYIIIIISCFFSCFLLHLNRFTIVSMEHILLNWINYHYYYFESIRLPRTKDNALCFLYGNRWRVLSQNIEKETFNADKRTKQLIWIQFFIV